MSARPNAWMPMYWPDYLADTGHLTAAEHGAYLLLIAHYWTSGKALPNEKAKLSRICRVSADEWEAMEPTIAEFFDVVGGCWRHKRIDKELASSCERYEKRSQAGKKGGRPKKQSFPREKAKLSQTESNAKATTTTTTLNTPPTPSEGESVSDDEPKDEIAHHFQTWWQQFPRYRRGAKGPTEKKYRSLCKRRQATPAALQTGLDRYLQAGYGSSKYAKGALAWLNGELWTVDEFPPAGDATGPPKPTIDLTPDEQTVHRAMMHVTMKGRSEEYYKLVELRESGRMAEALEMAKGILPEMQA